MAIVSDRLFVPQFIPTVLILISYTIYTGFTKIIIKSFVTIILGFVMGFKLLDFVLNSGYFEVLAMNTSFEFERILTSLKVLCELMLDSITSSICLALALSFFFVSLVGYSIYAIKYFKMKDREKGFKLFIPMLFISSILLTPIAAGNFLWEDQLRYNFSAFALGLLLIGILPFSLRMNIGRANLVLGLSLIVITGAIYLKPNTLKDITNYVTHYPNEVAQIDKLTKEYEVKRGISNYWVAKKTSVLSRNELEVLPADGINPITHGVNRNSFELILDQESDEHNYFEYIIFDDQYQFDLNRSKIDSLIIDSIKLPGENNIFCMMKPFYFKNGKLLKFIP